jgi:hypothetical protein
VEFEAVSQNEVHGTQWLSEVNEDYPYIMSFEEKEGSNALPDKFSENLNRSSKFTKIFEMPIYISKRVICQDMNKVLGHCRFEKIDGIFVFKCGKWVR